MAKATKPKKPKPQPKPVKGNTPEQAAGAEGLPSVHLPDESGQEEKE